MKINTVGVGTIGGPKSIWRAVFPAILSGLLCLMSASAHAGAGRPGAKCQPTTAQTMYGKSYAVIIGIDKYLKMNNLRGAVNDAKAIAKALTTRGFIVQTLLDEEATRKNISDLLSGPSLAGKLRRDDRVVFYFAGYGHRGVKRDGEGLQEFFMPHDADRRAPNSSAIPNRQVHAWLNALPAKHVLLLQDTDYGSRSWMGGPISQELSREPAQVNCPSSYGGLSKFSKTVRVAIYGTAPDQIANEETLGGRRHGAFTFWILKALKTGVADEDWDGLITAKELERYAGHKLKYHDRQTSTLSKQGAGEFVFFHDHHQTLAQSFYKDRVHPDCVAEASKKMTLLSRDLTPAFTSALYRFQKRKFLRAGQEPPSGTNRGRLDDRTLKVLFNGSPPAVCLSRKADETPRPRIVTRGAGVARNPLGGDLGTYRGLIIGVDVYQDAKTWTQLSVAVKDARAIHRVLTEKYGFSTDNLKLMVNEEATKASVIRALKSLRDSTQKGDNVFVYYAGHGDYEDTDQGKKEGACWILHDGVGKRCNNNVLPAERITKLLKKIAAKDPQHMLLVSDSCFSGELATRSTSDTWKKKGARQYKNLHRQPSYQVLTSGDGDQAVIDTEHGGHSPFAAGLLNILEAPDNDAGLVAGRDLNQAVFNTYKINDRIQYSAHLAPLSVGKPSKGDFVFVPSQKNDYRQGPAPDIRSAAGGVPRGQPSNAAPGLPTMTHKQALAQLTKQAMHDLLKSPLMRGWRTQAERGTLAKLGTLPIDNKTPYFLVKDVLLPTLTDWERALLNTGALKVIQVNPAKRAKGGKSSAKVTKAALKKAGVEFYLAGQLTAKSSKGEGGEVVEYTLSVKVHETADSSLRWRYDGKTEFLVEGSADTTAEPRRVVLHIENRRSEKWDSRVGGAKPDMRLRVNGKVQGPLCKDSDRCVFGCGFALKVPPNKPLRVKVVDSDTVGKDQTMGNLKSCPFPSDSSTKCGTPWLNVTLHPYSKVTCDALSKTRAKMF